jgi:D-sedoheptulose 7-phosphate isomerase
MCDAMHFAEELTGRFHRDRPALSAIALADPSHLTCVGNDYGFDKVFSRGVEAHGRAGDVLLAISTSGTSPNVLEAVRAAKARGIFSISLTGRPRSLLSEIADIDICAVGDESSPQPTERTQELHIKIIHLMIELVERELFPDLYAAEARTLRPQ